MIVLVGWFMNVRGRVMPISRTQSCILVAALSSCACAAPAIAEPFALASPNPYPASIFRPVMRDDAATREDQSLPPHLQRQVIAYQTSEAPGTIIIDTPNTYLYLVLGSGKALRYGIGVGREGFTWSGVETISRMAEWPDWIPPSEMIARQPYLPRFVAGGPGNPLGARALYLGNSAYRIHGTNDPSTIGHHVSSGCIRLTNTDVTDLYGRVKLGAKVVVLPQSAHAARSAATRPSVVPVAARVAPARASTVGAGSDAGFAFGVH
jgi:lipoprotein-anchoring transpeptidase ErfK/SrfK